MKRILWGLGLIALASAGTALASDNPLTTSSGVTDFRPTIQGAPTADLASLFQRQGLFDQSKITTWKTYSFGVTTGGGHTHSSGLLVQHLQYQISKPLTLHMSVGLEHNPLAMAGLNTGPQQASIVIPSLDLIYRPTDNVFVTFHYSNAPAYNARPWWERDSFGYGSSRW